MKTILLPLVVCVLSLFVAFLSYEVSVLNIEIDAVHRRCNVLQANCDENSIKLERLSKKTDSTLDKVLVLCYHR